MKIKVEEIENTQNIEFIKVTGVGMHSFPSRYIPF